MRDWNDALRPRLARLRLRPAREREIVDELSQHLDDRYRELREAGHDVTEAGVLADIERRDERDMGRADSPLKPADDAHLLDTSEMDIEAAFLAAKAIIDGVMAAGDKARHLG